MSRRGAAGVLGTVLIATATTGCGGHAGCRGQVGRPAAQRRAAARRRHVPRRAREPGERGPGHPRPAPLEVTHGPRSHRRVALTFDADMTEGMLGLLRTRRVRRYYD